VRPSGYSKMNMCMVRFFGMILIGGKRVLLPFVHLESGIDLGNEPGFLW
jgi:hypothetical protein